MITVDGLTKRYRGVTAVDDITFVACRIRHFPPAQIDEARRWLRADIPPAASERSR